MRISFFGAGALAPEGTREASRPHVLASNFLAQALAASWLSSQQNYAPTRRNYERKLAPVYRPRRRSKYCTSDLPSARGRPAEGGM